MPRNRSSCAAAEDSSESKDPRGRVRAGPAAWGQRRGWAPRQRVTFKSMTSNDVKTRTSLDVSNSSVASSCPRPPPSTTLGEASEAAARERAPYAPSLLPARGSAVVKRGTQASVGRAQLWQGPSREAGNSCYARVKAGTGPAAPGEVGDGSALQLNVHPRASVARGGRLHRARGRAGGRSPAREIGEGVDAPDSRMSSRLT